MRTQRIIISFLLLIALFPVEAQRRQRPDSMKHTEAEIENKRKEEIVKCTYIKNGNTFTGDVYATGEAGYIKIGTSAINFSNGHYKLTFTSGEFKVRDVQTPRNRGRYNPWRNEKIFNNFTQSGKFATFKKNGSVYLRLYDGESSDYITDIPLENVGANSFVLDEEGLRFEYSISSN